MSERRAGLEKRNVEADPPHRWGRPKRQAIVPPDLVGGGPSDRTLPFHRGNGDGMFVRGNLRNTGNPHGDGV